VQDKKTKDIQNADIRITERNTLAILKKILTRTGKIPVVVYKGIDISLNYYPIRGIRKYVDIDLGVRCQDYVQVKKCIARIPGVLLLNSETSWGNVFFGHALYIVSKNGLMIELHVSKNPKNLWEYLMGKEYANFFKNLSPVKLAKTRYYSLDKSEYLYMLIRQFLKKISMEARRANRDTLGPVFEDFFFIMLKTVPSDWRSISMLFAEKTIYMRFHDFYAREAWYLFFRYSQLRGYALPELIKKNLFKKSTEIPVDKLETALNCFRQGHLVDFKLLLEKPNFFLLLGRLLIIGVHRLLFPTRQSVHLR
jgi:hypothetical protein